MTDDLKARLADRLRQADELLNPPNGQIVQLDWDRVQSVIAERARIENSLAQLEVADATRAAAKAQSDLAEAQSADTASREDARLKQDDAAFWFRRFILSLQIGNGAGFVALAGGVLQADKPREVAVLAFPSFGWFAGGLILAGLVPGLLYLQRRYDVPRGGKRPRWARVCQDFATVFALTSAWFFGTAVLDGVRAMAMAAKPVATRAATVEPAVVAHKPMGAQVLAPTSPVRRGGDVPEPLRSRDDVVAKGK